MDPRHIVWITLDQELFAIRMGFGGKCDLSILFHNFILGVLESSKLSDNETEYNTDFRAVQIAVYRESGHNGKSKRFHVPEQTALLFHNLARDLRPTIEKYAADKEAVGKNLLVQMLKADIIGEATT